MHSLLGVGPTAVLSKSVGERHRSREMESVVKWVPDPVELASLPSLHRGLGIRSFPSRRKSFRTRSQNELMKLSFFYCYFQRERIGRTKGDPP